MAPHDTRSAVYWGEMVSRNSQPVGRPMEACHSAEIAITRESVSALPREREVEAAQRKTHDLEKKTTSETKTLIDLE